MSLKENCKERIFNVITKITEISKYVIMVVDKNCYNTLSIVSKNEELLENGVSLIELIDSSNRNELPDFDCIYFVSPEIETVKIILNDFKEEDNCKYKNVHIIFISSIKKNDGILDLIASNDNILKRIKSCACLNLNFFPYESRIFYFDNKLKLYDYYPLKNTKILYDLSDKLVSVCSCLKTWPYIRYQNSELCRLFAETFYNALNASDLFKLHKNENTTKKCVNKNDTNDNTESCFFENDTNEQNDKTKDKDKAKISTNSDLVLILDRSIDSSILFLHDYSYQSLCYDILKIETEFSNNMEETYYEYGSSNNEKTEPHTVIFEITNSDKNKEKKKAILTEDDELWSSYRHIHIQEVNEVIKNKIATFTEKNTVAKIKKKNILNPNEALEALRALPQYESMIEQYWLHVYLCDSCFKMLQNKNIVDIGLIEQDISCNVDKYGKELNFSKNNANVISIITSNEYEEEDKARLLLLYFINYININEHEKNKMIDLAQLSLFMRKFINEFLKLNIHLNYIYLDENINHSNKIYHILDKNRKKIKNYKNIAKNSKYELSRHEPNIKEILLNIHEQNLNKSQFPYVGHNIYEEKYEKKKGPAVVPESNVYRGTVWEFSTPHEKKHSEESQKNKLIQNKNISGSISSNNIISSSNVSSSNITGGNINISNNNKSKKKKIIIFIIGGITYPEIKYIYEMSKELDLDIY
uniref:Syntaxin binding protein n=1 Tax=Piliocolobus tephrosceles TaxID=591936 RepID=A0A8C9LI27_9PRIM